MCGDFRLRRHGQPSTAARALAAVLLLAAAGCATRTLPPPLPATPRYADFVYPTVPAALKTMRGAERIDAGWRYLQNDDLRSAEREFSAALRRSPELYPAHAGEGYVAVARGDEVRALREFDSALKADARYTPALVGRGLALLGLNRDADALAAFEAAMAADPALTGLRSRIEVLRFRNVQDMIEAARAAAAAGRVADARAAYQRALTASPESAFLHRELGLVERRLGDAGAALTHLRRAAELDPGDAASLADIGELLEQQQDFAGAEAAYRKAAEIEPSAALTGRIAAVAAKAREAGLPPEFRAIAASSPITRGELAALIGVRFEDLLRAAPPREVVMTDVQGHWAAPWMTLVARAGIMDPFENHTFQPRTRVRRGDLAGAVSRLLALRAADDAALRKRLAERPRIADMSTGHLQYPAAAVAVASGVMPLVDGDRFQVARAVTGQEAIQVIERLRALQ
jgi:tetratricopeptide (TPR) repeat protein